MTPDYSKRALEQLMLRYNIAAEVADMYYKAEFSVVVQDAYFGKNVQSLLYCERIDIFQLTPKVKKAVDMFPRTDNLKIILSVLSSHV